jgi:hypothetical protein
MGYYPKHLRKRQHKWQQYVVATAVLSGAVICQYSADALAPNDGYTLYDVPLYYVHMDGGAGPYDSRYEAACAYLMWWFQKHDIWPRDTLAIARRAKKRSRRRAADRRKPTGLRSSLHG